VAGGYCQEVEDKKAWVTRSQPKPHEDPLDKSLHRTPSWFKQAVSGLEKGIKIKSQGLAQKQSTSS
jgi:hypothetical protein